MNGNYEFVRQMARDKQNAFKDEAREHRLAKKPGSRKGFLAALAIVSRAGTRVHHAAQWAGEKASGYRSHWKRLLRGPGAATS